MAEFLSFLLEIVLPTVAVVYTMTKIAGARHNEDCYYSLVGVLARKGVLTMEDLTALKFFEPREDIVSVLMDVAKGS